MRIILATLSALAFAAPAYADRVNFYAASSTSEAVNEILAGYDPGPGNEVVAVYAATSTLARQIEAGAPADVILFANETWADYLEERTGFAPLSRADLLGNDLVLVVPRMSRPEFELAPEGAANFTPFEGRLAIGDPDGVPAGIYAREALEHFGEWDGLQGSLVYGENVRTVVNWVARAEVEAGIVYSSDAFSTSSLRVTYRYPADSHSPIRYPVAMMPEANERPEVIAFYNYLFGQEASEIFRAYGFRLRTDD